MERMLRGYAALRNRLGSVAPPLVVCGINTDKFDPAYRGSDDQPPWAAGRKLVGELGLRVGEDLFLLGLVSDPVMLWLFQNCRVVVNAAVHDNGSFNLIEGRYYGKRAVSTRYPAAEWLYERFGVPVRYCTPDVADDVAAAIELALADPVPTPDELADIRLGFTAPTLGLKEYAERMYAVLTDL
jgi:glycosyltransferase involved in cell wall biosynthesis